MQLGTEHNKVVVSLCEAKIFIIQAYIKAAEFMLEDDVASNKAIGSYGARFLQKQQNDSEKLSILTHCNTGRYHLLIFAPISSTLIILRIAPITWAFLHC